MSGALTVWVEGIGAWTPGLPDWPTLRAVSRGEGEPDADMPERPRPEVLPAGERRRAPTSVLVAIEAAAQAVAMSGRDAADLPCVFASAHGDGTIMDYMCETLAQAPREMSPTRFHNSVHNAAAGYWTIATGCHAGSSAAGALTESFGAGLLEATVMTVADARPVLLSTYDVAGTGPLAEMITSTRPLATALVLSPTATPTAMAKLTLELEPRQAPVTERPRQPALRALFDANLTAQGLLLLEALAGSMPATLHLKAAATLGLNVHTEVIP